MPPAGWRKKSASIVMGPPKKAAVARVEDSNTPGLEETDAVPGHREQLIRERQEELGTLLDKHDELVREAFHMERFVTLLYYDPVEAKNDQTAVFREYKEKYNLAETAPVAGPSRTTRRAQNERISALASHAIRQPAHTLQSSGKTTETADHNSVSAVQDMRRLNGRKGKRKDDGATASREEVGELSARRDGRLSAKARGKQRAIDESISTAPSARRSMTASVRSTSPHLHLSKSRSKLNRSQSTVDPPVKRPRLSLDLTTRAEESISSSRPVIARKTVAGKTVPKKAAPSETPKPSIRRIRLIVKEPPPLISSPTQKPGIPQFNRSLTSLLSSYTELDGKVYTAEALEKVARRDARTLEKADALRKQGRLALYISDEDGGAPPAHQPQDIWANVVKDAISMRNSMSRYRFGRGGMLAHTLHTRLTAHWETRKLREEREAAVEERRLRVLARSILRLIINEWRRVESHVREEERRVVEQEEKRLGRQHLDKILDQSGQILEKQQMELIRAETMRSRSGSVSLDTEDEDSDVISGTDEGSQSDDEEYEKARSVDEASDIGTSEAGTQADDYEDADTDALLLPPKSQDADKESYVDFIVPLKDDENDENISVDDVGDEQLDLHEEVVFEELDPQQEQEIVLDVDMDDASTSSFIKARSLSAADTTSSSTPITDAFDVDATENTVFDYPFGSPIGPAYDTADSPIIPKTESYKLDTESLSKLFQPPASDSPVKLIGINGRQPKTPEGIPNGYQFKTKKSQLDSWEIASAIENLPNSEEQQPEGEPQSRKSDEDNSDLKSAEPMAETPEKLDSLSQDKMEVDGADDLSGERQLSPEPDQEHISEEEADPEIPEELLPYAVARVRWSPDAKLLPPLLLRGTLRPYQFAGLEWLASLHNNNMNGILADEMGLGKTIQTISLLAHLACDRGIWGPHLIIVPTSVLLNWEMEFKKFLPGFKILSYHGTSKRRKELRRGWFDKHNFNVCVTSYTLASKDHHVFKRKAWYYMILDEAHMIKNFRSQRWNILLMFRSFRRLLLTGTPLQNNLTELWALLQFLMSGSTFANLKDFGDWFSNPLEKAIEQGNVQDEEVQAQVTKLHTVLRPYLLRRLKRDVEKELPSKYEHLVLCRLSKRQRFLYDEFMSRSQTRQDLDSGIYQKIANILMQLRKVCNHPDLFEVRPIVTSFAMDKSAIADYEVKELLVRRRLLQEEDEHFSNAVNLSVLGLRFIDDCNTPMMAAEGARSLEENLSRAILSAHPTEHPPRDLCTIEGYKKYNAFQRQQETYQRYQYMAYLNRLRCSRVPIYSLETINKVNQCHRSLTDVEGLHPSKRGHLLGKMLKSYVSRANDISDLIDKFAFATPAVVALDLPSLVLRSVPNAEETLQHLTLSSSPSLSLSPNTDSTSNPNSISNFDTILHRPAVKLQIAFPDVSLLQYDCGKLQELARLLQERKAGGHRVLIFTQMTRILDILEMFLNYHGYLYLRLDGATKIEDRQYITERFNVDERIFAFIASSRSGGVGINLTGADTVIFYDSDFNPQMDRQCEDRAHRIGQIRDVHIYRFISQHTVEEAMLRKANQKRSLDDLVIQQGDFDWRRFFGADVDGQQEGAGVSSSNGVGGAGGGVGGVGGSGSGDTGGGRGKVGMGGGVGVGARARALQKALVEFEDYEDAHAAKVAASEEAALLGEDRDEFGETATTPTPTAAAAPSVHFHEDDNPTPTPPPPPATSSIAGRETASSNSTPHMNGQAEEQEPVQEEDEEEEEEEEEGGTVTDYMLRVVRSDREFFKEMGSR